MKNLLSISKAVKGTETYEQLETRMDTLLQNYYIQLTKNILEVTKFEVEQKKKKLFSAINNCIYDLANTLTIVKLNTTKWLNRIERKEIATHAALKIYKTLLRDILFSLLTTESDDVIASFKLEHMKYGIREISELPYYQGYEDSHLIQRFALSRTNTLLSLTRNVPSLTLRFLARKVKK